jgi:chaperonin GroEL
MKAAGIIDPAKVTRTALENAASVAGTILLTECVIVDNPEDKTEVDPMAGMMGGMM